MECLYQWGRLEFNEIKRSKAAAFRNCRRSASDPTARPVPISSTPTSTTCWAPWLMATGVTRRRKDWFECFINWASQRNRKIALGKRYAEAHVEEVEERPAHHRLPARFLEKPRRLHPFPSPIPISESIRRIPPRDFRPMDPCCFSPAKARSRLKGTFSLEGD